MVRCWKTPWRARPGFILISTMAVMLVILANCAIPELPSAGVNAPARCIESYQHITFTSDSPFDTSQEWVRALAHHQQTVANLLDRKPTSPPIRVVLFDNGEEYFQFCRQNFPNLPERRALFVKHGQNFILYAVRGKELPVDLRHETTHAYLHHLVPGIPLWLDEGLAEYFEIGDHREVGHEKHLKHVVQLLDDGWKPNLPKLEQHRDMTTFGSDQYAESWLWVHFCQHYSPVTQSVWKKYLHDLAKAEHATGVPLQPRIYKAIPNADELLIAHARQYVKQFEQSHVGQSENSVKKLAQAGHSHPH